MISHFSCLSVSPTPYARRPIRNCLLSYLICALSKTVSLTQARSSEASTWGSSRFARTTANAAYLLRTMTTAERRSGRWWYQVTCASLSLCLSISLAVSVSLSVSVSAAVSLSLVPSLLSRHIYRYTVGFSVVLKNALLLTSTADRQRHLLQPALPHPR